MSKEGPLGKLWEHGGAVPYYVAGAIWRGLQQHVGMTKKDAEAAWKVEWNKEYKVKFDAFRKDNAAFKQQLDIDAMVWMEEVWQKLDDQRTVVGNELAGVVVDEEALVEDEEGAGEAPQAPVPPPAS